MRGIDPQFEPFNAVIYGHYTFAKGTVQLSQSHRLEASAISSAQKAKSGSRLQTRVTTIGTTGGRGNTSASMSSLWGSHITTKVGFSYNDLGSTSTPLFTEPPGTVSSQTTSSGGRLLGIDSLATIGGASGFESPYSKITAYADLTLFQAGLAGEHEFRAGFYFQPRNHIEITQTYPTNGIASESYVLNDPQDPTKGMTLFARHVLDANTFTSTLADSRDSAIYVQDAWRIANRVTVNAGVRVDLIKRTDKIFNVVTQDSANVGPRFGINWALSDDHSQVMRASWGRIHDVVSSTTGSAAGTHSPGFRDFYDTDLNGTFETVFVTPEVTALAANRLIDTKRVQPFVDEWTVGFKQAFRGRLSVDVGVVRRAYKNRPAQVEQNGVYDNGIFTGYRDQRFLDLFQLTGNRWNWPVYYDVGCQVVKDTSRLRLIGSYTRAWRHLAGTWQPNDPASFIQPGAFPNDHAFGGALNGADSYAGGGNNIESSPAWQDHIGRVGLLYRAFWHVTLASNYIIQSGPFSGPIVKILPAPDPSFGPPTVTLPNGPVVSNPLATTVRFAYATRGEGQLKLPALQTINVRVGRDFVLRGHQRVEIAAETLNLANAARDQSFQFGGNILGNVNYGTTTSRQLPRSARITARLTF